MGRLGVVLGWSEGERGESGFHKASQAYNLLLTEHSSPMTTRRKPHAAWAGIRPGSRGIGVGAFLLGVDGSPEALTLASLPNSLCEDTERS